MRAFQGLPLPSTDGIVELHLVGRKTGRRRDVLVGMSRIDGRLYVGHPNGPTAWLANLAAADAATLQIKHQPPIQVRSVPLDLGPERDAAIRATARQEWLVIRPVYWASRRHILRAGVYHRLDVITGEPTWSDPTDEMESRHGLRLPVRETVDHDLAAIEPYRLVTDTPPDLTWEMGLADRGPLDLGAVERLWLEYLTWQRAASRPHALGVRRRARRRDRPPSAPRLPEPEGMAQADE